MNRIKRNFLIWRNHILRIRKTSETMKSPEEIIKARDMVYRKMLDSERTGDKENLVKFQAQFSLIKWILNENGSKT